MRSIAALAVAVVLGFVGDASAFGRRCHRGGHGHHCQVVSCGNPCGSGGYVFEGGGCGPNGCPLTYGANGSYADGGFGGGMAWNGIPSNNYAGGTIPYNQPNNGIPQGVQRFTGTFILMPNGSWQPIQETLQPVQPGRVMPTPNQVPSGQVQPQRQQ